MKKKRQELILKLIKQYEVSTQEDLMLLLEQNGCPVTQATVSRDIKELQLIKMPTADGKIKYAVSQRSMESKPYNLLMHSVQSADAAGNIVAIKCFAGTANAAGAAIDTMHIPEIVASLAGDDTLFVLCRNPENATYFKEKIQQMLNGE